MMKSPSGCLIDDEPYWVLTSSVSITSGGIKRGYGQEYPCRWISLRGSLGMIPIVARRTSVEAKGCRDWVITRIGSCWPRRIVRGENLQGQRLEGSRNPTPANASDTYSHGWSHLCARNMITEATAVLLVFDAWRQPRSDCPVHLLIVTHEAKAMA